MNNCFVCKSDVRTVDCVKAQKATKRYGDVWCKHIPGELAAMDIEILYVWRFGSKSGEYGQGCKPRGLLGDEHLENL